MEKLRSRGGKTGKPGKPGQSGKPGKSATENSDKTGFDNDATYINGREHKKVSSKKGKETYIYQPSTTSSEDYVDKYRITPEMAEFYNTLDTTTKFEIRRPKVQEGHLYNL